MNRRHNRRLLVGHNVYRWRLSHRHSSDAFPFDDCRETLTIRRDGCHGRIAIVFASGPDRRVPDGLLHSGGLMRPSDDSYLNLNRPGAVRALLDAALAEHAGFGSTTEIDGWRFFDAALACATR